MGTQQQQLTSLQERAGRSSRPPASGALAPPGGTLSAKELLTAAELLTDFPAAQKELLSAAGKPLEFDDLEEDDRAGMDRHIVVSSAGIDRSRATEEDVDKLQSFLNSLSGNPEFRKAVLARARDGDVIALDDWKSDYLREDLMATAPLREAVVRRSGREVLIICILDFSQKFCPRTCLRH